MKTSMPERDELLIQALREAAGCERLMCQVNVWEGDHWGSHFSVMSGHTSEMLIPPPGAPPERMMVVPELAKRMREQHCVKHAPVIEPLPYVNFRPRIG